VSATMASVKELFGKLRVPETFRLVFGDGGNNGVEKLVRP